MEPILPAYLTARQQLAAAVRWARTNGWQRTMRGWLSPAGDALVELSSDGDELGVMLASDAGRWPQQYTWYRVHTFRQGIELLVTLGLLPEQLSAVYTAGYGAGWRAHALRPESEAERLSTRCQQLARMAGRAQEIAYSQHPDRGWLLGELRDALAAAGYADPMVEQARAVAEHGDWSAEVAAGGWTR